MRLASIIVQLAESIIYSLHWHLSDIQNNCSSKNRYIDMLTDRFSLFSLVVLSITAACHNQFAAPGLALGSKVKSQYIIEHNVSITFGRIIITCISRNCWHSIIQEVRSCYINSCRDSFFFVARLLTRVFTVAGLCYVVYILRPQKRPLLHVHSFMPHRNTRLLKHRLVYRYKLCAITLISVSAE